MTQTDAEKAKILVKLRVILQQNCVDNMFQG